MQNGDTFAPLLFTPRPATGRTDYASPRYGAGRHAGSPSAGDRGAAPSFSRLGSLALRDGATPRGRGGTPGPGGAGGGAGGGPSVSLAGAPSLFESSFDSPPTASLMAVDDGVTGAPSARPAPPQAAAGAADGGAWVTAFGFAPRDAPLALDALAACGDVLAFGSGRHDAVNWVHVQFANKHQAARALARDGTLLAGRVILGVRPLDPAHRAEAAAVAAGDAGAGAPGALRAAPPSVPARPYRVDAPSSDGLPAPAGGPWSKVAQFVFGA